MNIDNRFRRDIYFCISVDTVMNIYKYKYEKKKKKKILFNVQNEAMVLQAAISLIILINRVHLYEMP